MVDQAEVSRILMLYGARNPIFCVTRAASDDVQMYLAFTWVLNLLKSANKKRAFSTKSHPNLDYINHILFCDLRIIMKDELFDDPEKLRSVFVALQEAYSTVIGADKFGPFAAAFVKDFVAEKNQANSIEREQLIALIQLISPMAFGFECAKIVTQRSRADS